VPSGETGFPAGIYISLFLKIVKTGFSNANCVFKIDIIESVDGKL